jgi:hypothetical protein
MQVVASPPSTASHRRRTRNIAVVVLALCAASILVATQITLFVIQPIGAVPDGRTLLLWRLNTMQFIDSADGWCQREQGGVSLLCRLAVLGKVANNDTIITSLPYSETLYSISTGGRSYDR